MLYASDAMHVESMSIFIRPVRSASATSSLARIVTPAAIAASTAAAPAAAPPTSGAGCVGCWKLRPCRSSSATSLAQRVERRQRTGSERVRLRRGAGRILQRVLFEHCIGFLLAGKIENNVVLILILCITDGPLHRIATLRKEIKHILIDRKAAPWIKRPTNYVTSIIFSV